MSQGHEGGFTVGFNGGFYAVFGGTITFPVPAVSSTTTPGSSGPSITLPSAGEDEHGDHGDHGPVSLGGGPKDKLKDTIGGVSSTGRAALTKTEKLAATPEPATLFLLGTGLVGIAAGALETRGSASKRKRKCERGDRIAWVGLGGTRRTRVRSRAVAARGGVVDRPRVFARAHLRAAGRGIVWARRDRLTRLRLAPSAAGLAGAAVSIALLLVGTLGAELFLTRASLLLFIASSVVFLFGWQHLRGVAFPFAILALSIPIPALLMTHITLPLQFAASAAAETTLSAVHIPVLREGNVLVLPDATLQVAEACSGVRSMMSLLVLAVLVARNMDTDADPHRDRGHRGARDHRRQRGPRHRHRRGDASTTASPPPTASSTRCSA